MTIAQDHGLMAPLLFNAGRTGSREPAREPDHTFLLPRGR